MTSSYDFIVDGIRYSFSSITTFETCPYSFKLNYIDRVSPKEDNFFGQYGNLVHECFHQFFLKKLESYELSGYFRDNYARMITAPPPPFPANMEERYKQEGMFFFDNFSFDLDNFEVILAEDKVEFELDEGTLFVAKPDLVLLDKNRNNFLLVDYKTAAPFKTNKRTGKETTDQARLNGYYKQLYLYTYALRNFQFTPIDNIILWFTRPDRKVQTKWDEDKELDALAWAEGTLKKIKDEEEFPPNTRNSYFCNNLCSVRSFCEYRQKL